MVKKPEKPKFVFTTGKRKDAVARAKIIAGKGIVKINSSPVDVWGNEFLRMRVTEPLVLAGDLSSKVNIYVSVRSGGIVGQTEAARMAIARALVDFSNDKKLKEKLIEYDRNLLVYDPRRNEPHKPGSSKPRAHKQRSKR